MNKLKKRPESLAFAHRCLVLLLLLLVTSAANAELIVLSYHEVDHAPERRRDFEAMSMNTSELAKQFSWLKENGYVSVTIDDLLAAQRGKRPLPEKAVLLTFDDGYRGMYEQVFPLLKVFDFHAVVAVVGSWLETPPGKTVLYGGEKVPRSHFLRWSEIREMIRSGRVEIASHSYDLHHGILANPQGNVQPAAVTRRYDPETRRYESDERYRQRIRKDLLRNSALIERKTGFRPRVMVWPYGAYNRVTVEIARQLGMPITMSLADEKMDIRHLGTLGRLLIGHDSNLENLVWQINNHNKPRIEPVRVMHLDLDYVYDPNPVQQERNLDRLLDRVKAMGVNTVYLQAFADPDGDGNTDALYFPNRHLPVRADLFNRVAWQLRTRTGVKVYAWLPVLAYDLPPDHPLAGTRVTASPPHEPGAESYRRLSPFSKRALRFVGDIYEDLAKHAYFEGLIFHDDAYLDDYEDAGPAALDVYRRQWNLPAEIEAIRTDPELFRRWSRLKTKQLARWTDTLTERALKYRPRLKTARNMYAAVVMNPNAETWFAQSMEVFLEHYDYTAVMAMPYMERAENPEAWLRKLVSRIAAIPGVLDRTVFELQSVDWRSGKPIESSTLARQMRLLQKNGVIHFGYYPDDFIQGLPALESIRPVISLKFSLEEK